MDLRDRFTEMREMDLQVQSMYRPIGERHKTQPKHAEEMGDTHYQAEITLSDKTELLGTIVYFYFSSKTQSR